MQSKDRFGIILAFTATTLFSFKAVVAKSAYRHGVDPMTLLHMRLYIAAPLLLLTWYARRGRAAETMRPKTILAAAALGTFGITTAMAASFYAISYIDASLANVVTFTYPVFTVLILIPLTKRLPGRRIWLALIATFAGIFLVADPDFGPAMSSPDYRYGIGLALTSAICFAMYNALGERLLVHVSGMQLAAIGTSAATLTLILLAGFRWHFDPIIVAHALLLGIVSGYLPFMAYPLALKHIGAARLVIITTLGPPLTLTWAALLLGERMSLLQLMGMGLVLVGVVVAKTRNRTTPVVATTAPAPYPATPHRAGRR